MTIVVPSDLAAAIEASERTPLVRVLLDWDGDGFGPAGTVDDLTGKQGTVRIDRTILTDLPADVRLVEGSAAATGTVELAIGDPLDESMHAARYFTRGTDSPIGHKERLNLPVAVEIGMMTASGPQYVRRITGLSRKFATKSRGRSASLSLVDNRARLRNTVTLIPTDGTVAGADGTWIVTQALAANGIYAGPAPNSRTLFWAPCYGSVRTIIGGPPPATEPSGLTDQNGLPTRPPFIAGPFVTAVAPHYTSTTDYAILDIAGSPALPWTGTRGRLELWTNAGGVLPSPGIVGDPDRTSLGLSQGSPFVSVRLGVRRDGHAYITTGAGTVLSTAIVPASGWQPVGIEFDHTLGTVTFRIGGLSETLATGITPAQIPVTNLRAAIFSYSPVSDILFSEVAPSTPWASENVAATAVLDPSLLPLQASYEAAPRDSWDLIGEVAAAEQAVAAFDEAGMFRYRTRRRLTDLAGQTAQRVLTTDDASLLDVDIDDGLDQIRNIVQVGYTVATVRTGNYVYRDTTIVTVAAGSTVLVQLAFVDPVVDLTYVSGLTQVLSYIAPVSVAGRTPAMGGYVVITTHSDGTDDASAAINQQALTSSLVAWTPTGVSLRFTNNGPVSVYIAGVAMVGTSVGLSNTVVAQVSDPTSISRYGPQSLQISASQWVQTAGVTNSLAAAVLGDVKDPHPQLSGLRIVGDPRRQLGDRVRIADPSGTQLDGEYWLTQIVDEVDANGAYTQTIAARAATTVARYDTGRYDIETYA
jgi:hypothetical protein